MKVKIIKCSVDAYWYYKYIGEDFDVIEEFSDIPFYTISSGDNIFRYIIVDDCIDVNELREYKLKRILDES